MQTIILETKIAAPIERCFLLSLSIDLHKASTEQTNEEAIAGRVSGLIKLGESVTWRARHFGLILTHETLISYYERPRYFQDVMIKGAFKSFVHNHRYESISDSETLMRDEIRFSAPLGPLGLIAELLVLKRYLTGFLVKRNTLIKEVAESDDYMRFISQSR